MGRIYQIVDPTRLRARRAEVEGGAALEVWPDIVEPGACWLAEAAWMRLAPPAPEAPPVRLVLDGDQIPIIFPEAADDDGSLPEADSIRTRLLARRGIAAFWIPPGEVGPQVLETAVGPQDLFFFLKRVGAGQAHLWRLFRSRYDARGFLARRYPGDPRVESWLGRLPHEDFDALVRAAAVPPPPPPGAA